MKPKSTQQWGLDTAKERYPAAKGGLGVATGQAVQCPEDKHGPGYDNDTPSNWLRGMGPKHAEAKPGFDKGGKS